MNNERYLIAAQEGLSIRTKNALARGGLKYLTDIKSMSQLHRIRNIGADAIEQISLCIKKQLLPVPPEVDFVFLPSSRFKKKMALEIAIEVLMEHSEQEGFRERDLCVIEQIKELLLKM